MKRTALVAVALVAGCSNSTSTKATSTPTPTPSPTPSPTASPAYSVDLVPADFSAKVTNPWFPLPPGRTLEYRGVNEDGAVRELFFISDEVQKVGGVTCRVVLDRL